MSSEIRAPGLGDLKEKGKEPRFSLTGSKTPAILYIGQAKGTAMKTLLQLLGLQPKPKYVTVSPKRAKRVRPKRIDLKRVRSDPYRTY